VDLYILSMSHVEEGLGIKAKWKKWTKKDLSHQNTGTCEVCRM